MSRTNDWTPEQIEHFEVVIRALKKEAGDEPFALTPDQRALAVELGLLPPLSVQIEATLGPMTFRGSLHLDEDGIYRGMIFPKKGFHE